MNSITKVYELTDTIVLTGFIKQNPERFRNNWGDNSSN